MSDAPTTTTTTTTTSTTGDQQQQSDKKQHQKWFPLESNPTLMNQYISALGWDTSQYHFVDVYSTEDWALEMIAQPVLAVLLLYPLTAVQLQHEQQEQQALVQSNQVYDSDHHPEPVWFTKQRIGNACGTIGLLHAMMNAPKRIQSNEGSSSSPTPLIKPDSWLDAFAASTATTATNDPIRRAEILEQDTMIASLHDAATSSTENSTVRGDLDDDILTHFIAFVIGRDNDDTTNNNNSTSNNTTTTATALYELDGRKSQPIRHLRTDTNHNNNTTLLKDACTIIQEQFMARDPEELRFTILALVPNTE